jgi:hypothetical protein
MTDPSYGWLATILLGDAERNRGTASAVSSSGGALSVIFVLLDYLRQQTEKSFVPMDLPAAAGKQVLAGRIQD